MKIGAWNIRGLNRPLKQNGVRHFMKQHDVDVMGILETKLGELKLNRVMRNKFNGLMQVNNFLTHKAGRILILWNPSKVKLEVLETASQVIHCIATCKRPLWRNIMDFSTNVSLYWMILGDFNNVLKFDEKSNGAEVIPYEIKDFANYCQHVGLTVMRSVGCLYTWTNNSVWSRTDRAMVNDVWGQKGIYGLEEYLPSECLSDHSPCVVSIFERGESTRKPFKFFNKWTNHEVFHGLVQVCWNFDVVGTKQFILCKKLHNLKGALKELNAKHFGHISIRANDAKRELKATQLRLHDQPANVHYQLTMAQLRKKAMGLCEAERSFYYQQANYLVHPIELDILRNGPLVSLEQGSSLTWDISSQEIKEALFSIGDDKSPGLDGYASYFFKKAWRIVGDDVVEAIKEFFLSRSLLKQINHTIIALVPKSNHTPNVGDYRPLSCCNVIYKVISKILASRLRPILETIVDQAQAAFVEVGIGLKKAYDSVNWDFLKEVLEGLRFLSRFVQWVMECITTPTYSVALNESLHGFFKGRKGLRQGDLLSPFLFILCLEYFSRMIKAVSNDNEFNYHTKCGHLKITHLAFSDDLMLFTKGDVMLVQILMDCLSNFGNALGLRMNTLKSSLFAAGIMGKNLKKFKHSLISRRVNQFYLNGASIWNVLPKKDDSPLIKKLLVIRDFILRAEHNEQAAVHKLSNLTCDDRFNIFAAYEFFRPKGTNVIWAKSIDRKCYFCEHVDETTGHLFLGCPFSCTVWEKVIAWRVFIYIERERGREGEAMGGSWRRNGSFIVLAIVLLGNYVYFSLKIATKKKKQLKEAAFAALKACLGVSLYRL
ncbi:uncharacterized protein LOC111368907 [Olea europaea var. sylvestris]|uniref:uncharacterized protein LOC111368907 n=1 Tax=Olea europaea var. sylvestris TaxID=158386 RepID=UPI000C1D8821|nr:uncharacterized protein LOC111368907 [Olea europaea var. sylvestris]